MSGLLSLKQRLRLRIITRLSFGEDEVQRIAQRIRLSFGEDEVQRIAQRIDDDMNLAGESALGTA
jgi:hypothetical protein